MYLIEGRLVVSPSDLTGYLACEHLTQLELAVTRGELTRPKRTDPELDVVTRRGLEHEKRYLEALRSGGRRIVEIDPDGSTLAALQQAEAQTLAAMRDGADVIYQATFFDGRWRCHADFLMKVARPSTLGQHSYEAADTKLALRARASALLQLCGYSEQIERLQGAPPENMQVILGDMTIADYRLADHAAYYRTIKQRFEETVLRPALSTYPDPVAHCSICRWNDACTARRRVDDHLSLVAGMGRSQTEKLVESGIQTVARLAASPDGTAVPGIGQTTLDRLRQQAKLQLAPRSPGTVIYQFLPSPGPGLGLALLPAPSPGDLFFDIEGDPFADNGSLEYLFGVTEIVDGRPLWTPFWGHTRDDEKKAFENLVDRLIDRLNRDPDLHVYHYASYEPTALKRLMGTYGSREAEIDRLLRGGVLVDLYTVVRQSLRISQESYGLKKLEPLYSDPRDMAIVDAAGSMVAYEQWLQTRDPALLENIGAYNAYDCESTWRLRNWLEVRRSEAEAAGETITRPPSLTGQPSPGLKEAERVTVELGDALLENVPEDAKARDLPQQGRWLLAQSLGWHRREAKSEWWNYFRLCRLTDEELVDEREAIGGLTYDSAVDTVKQSIIHRYRFNPEQEYKIGVGDTPDDPRRQAAAGEVVALDATAGTIDLKRGANSKVTHPTSLVPAQPIDSPQLRASLLRLGRWVLENGIEANGPYQAARDLLVHELPRILGHAPGSALIHVGETATQAARRCAVGLDHSVLAVQGPPGSGKTYTGADLILDLVQQKKRVGITAISHKVIGNLLDELCRHAAERAIAIRVVQKAGPHERCNSEGVQCTNDNDAVVAGLEADAVDVVGGTPFLFAREAMAGRLDTLVVDEAGQMSMANLLAIAQSADNLVLLGDPNQLPQPTHGVHPPGVNVSALQHVIGDLSVLAPERGIFLDQTYRMHPDVCRYISEVFYDSQLHPVPDCALQVLADGTPYGATGIRFVPMMHHGNRTVSAEEVDWVGRHYERLLSLPWTGRDGRGRPIGSDDILVVAPYNAQVQRLTRGLPGGARIGTVDKFQGQQAPVVFYSMASSSPEEAPRGIEFLYSLNRLNVAISRAQGLAILVCSKELLRVRCRTPEQMRMANALCRFVEMSTALVVPP